MGRNHDCFCWNLVPSIRCCSLAAGISVGKIVEVGEDLLVLSKYL